MRAAFGPCFALHTIMSQLELRNQARPILDPEFGYPLGAAHLQRFHIPQSAFAHSEAPLLLHDPDRLPIAAQDRRDIPAVGIDPQDEHSGITQQCSRQKWVKQGGVVRGNYPKML